MIINKKEWNVWVKKNKDFYGKACVDVAREVMRLLDTQEYKDFDANKIIIDANNNLETGGITGFMAGCVAQIVSICHSRGEEFKKKWNFSYGKKDIKGVVNPAILVIGDKNAKKD